MSVRFREPSDGGRYDDGRYPDGPAPSRYDDGPRYRDGPPPRDGPRDGPRDYDRYQDTTSRMDDRDGGSRYEQRVREETTTRVDDSRGGDRGRDFGERVSDKFRDFGDRTRDNFRDFGDRVRGRDGEEMRRGGEEMRGGREEMRQSTEYRQSSGGEGRGGSEEHSFGEHSEKHRSKHPHLHKFGEAVTKGEGAGGYLQAYLKELEKNPLRTKMLTSGTLAGAQELLASYIASDRNKSGNYFTSRVPKMAVYGALISAPMGHFFVKLMHFLFAHRSSLKAKIFQILFSNLIVSPIQNTVYLVAMAIIAGARTIHQVRATVRAGFLPVMRVSWITSPLCLAFAQQFLPEQTWVPFFNIVAFVIGTYINAHTKKKRLAALRRRREQEGYGRTTSDYRGGVGGGGGGVGVGGEYRAEGRSEYDARSARGPY